MNPNLGKALLWIARKAISSAVEPHKRNEIPLLKFDPETNAQLAELGAVFVTLTIDGHLRGCIGSLLAHRPLAEDCEHNAVAAALQDTRFPPLSPFEVNTVRIEVSLISPAQNFPCTDETDACARLQPKEHGVILSYHGHRATFLPQVWEQLPDPKEFLAALKYKAGIPRDVWDSDLMLQVYHVEHIIEADL